MKKWNDEKENDSEGAKIRLILVFLQELEDVHVVWRDLGPLLDFPEGIVLQQLSVLKDCNQKVLKRQRNKFTTKSSWKVKTSSSFPSPTLSPKRNIFTVLVRILER